MDIFASKLLHILSLAAAAAIALSVCGAFVVVVRSARGSMPAPALKRLVRIWMSVALPLLLLVGGTMLLLRSSAWRTFNLIMAQKPARLLISAHGKTNEITDPSAIDQFFRSVARSKKISPHHSHPFAPVTLVFPQTGHIFSLARDSQNPGEFWFGWSGIAGRERAWLDVGASLGQLRSDELVRWVDTHEPVPAIPGPAASSAAQK